MISAVSVGILLNAGLESCTGQRYSEGNSMCCIVRTLGLSPDSAAEWCDLISVLGASLSPSVK